jgi:D-alanyl-D-alanine carboxypeptidase
MIRRHTSYAAVLTLLVLAPASARAAGETERLQAAAQAFIARHHISGVTVAASVRGKTYATAAGMADTDKGLAMPSNAVMPCGSVGKTFVAALALQLAAEGRLDLDARISTWLGDEPWFPRLANGRTATLRMLLNHTAGIPDHRGSDGFTTTLAGKFANLDREPDFLLPPAQLVSFILDKPATFPAGQGWSYSETGYVLAGMIIEKATGQSVFALEESEFLRPLGLTQTTPAMTRNPKGLVNGYFPENPFHIPREMAPGGVMKVNPRSEFTGGGLYCSSRDLVHWAQALYTGSAVKGDYLPQLFAAIPTGGGHGFAYGLGVRFTKTSNGPAFGHLGEFPGYVTLVAYYPNAGVAVAAQVNSAMADPGLLEELQDDLAGAAMATPPSRPRSQP